MEVKVKGMADYTSQRRTILESETSDLSAISVHQIKHLEQSVNAMALVVAPRLSFLFTPALTTDSGDTDENVIAVFSPFIVPAQYDQICWSINGKVSTGVSSEITLYTSNLLYNGDTTLNTAILDLYDSDSLTISSSSNEIKHGSIDSIKRNSAGQTYLFLTASNFLSTDEIELLTCDITCQIASAYS